MTVSVPFWVKRVALEVLVASGATFFVWCDTETSAAGCSRRPGRQTTKQYPREPIS
jgi:hypothetical protein